MDLGYQCLNGEELVGKYYEKKFIEDKSRRICDRKGHQKKRK